MISLFICHKEEESPRQRPAAARAGFLFSHSSLQFEKKIDQILSPFGKRLIPLYFLGFAALGYVVNPNLVSLKLDSQATTLQKQFPLLSNVFMP